MNRSPMQKYRGNEAVLPWQTRVGAGERKARAPIFDWPQPRIVGALRQELAAAWAACGAFEWVALGYLGVSSALIVAFAENLAHPARLLGLQVCVGCVILALCGAEASVRADKRFSST